MIIKPTIGRVVLVFGGDLNQEQWQPALICRVHEDNKICVAGFDEEGFPFSITDLYLLQGEIADDPVKISDSARRANELRPFACWMPYQRQAQARESERAAQVPSQR